MKQYKEKWLGKITDVIQALMKEKNIEIDSIESLEIIPENPPKPEMGDIAFPVFKCARYFKMAPPKIAAEVAEKLKEAGETEGCELKVMGPYINVFLNKGLAAKDVVEEIKAKGEKYCQTGTMEGNKRMIEFSCPNTNKPLHLGHMRNDSLGECVSRILKANNADVMKVNLINDRGIHICKSMLAYREFGNGTTPESEGKKSDHFVGDYYVKFAQWAKEDESAEAKARTMLQEWEAGKEDVVELWKTMNKWTIDGIKETYVNTGVSFDKYYYESETYLSGKEEILKGLEKGIFFKKEDGSIWINLEEYGLDEKVLLRGDGTSLYITQDIGTAIKRQEDWPFESLVYVVGSEQQYHFKVLFKVLELLGNPWAKNLAHLSYGMVNLPHGKMKSREGTVVDADNLLAELIELSTKEIKERDRENEIDNIEETAKKIALGALNYFLLAASPTKDMVFNPAESIAFNGNTGPYLQYTGARIASILRKFEARTDEFAGFEAKPERLTEPQEWEIVKILLSFPETISAAGEELNPSLITVQMYELAKNFSRYYHDTPILRNDDKELVVSRIELIRRILTVFKAGLDLLGVPFLDKM